MCADGMEIFLQQALVPRGNSGRETISGGQVEGPGGAKRHGLGVGVFELLPTEAAAQLVQAVLRADVAEARRACGHAGPYRSAGGRLVGERDDAVRCRGCAEKLQRERLAVATASRSPAD